MKASLGYITRYCLRDKKEEIKNKHSDLACEDLPGRKATFCEDGQ